MFSNEQLHAFRENGFLIVPDALPSSSVTLLRERIELLFNHGDVKHKPGDEWACRRNLASTGLKHMVNAWKGDEAIAALFTDSLLGQAIATLGGWSGARMTSDAVWWKPPHSDSVPFHQDSLRVQRFLSPGSFITCWIALDECTEEMGALQYVRGSHQWAPIDMPPSVQAESIHYQASLRAAVKAHGINQFDIITVQGGAGTCAFHDGLMWHGSARNLSGDRPRRALAAHFVTPEARFIAPPTSPHFAYYKQADSEELNEASFPIVWRESGYRSPGLDAFSVTNPQWFSGNQYVEVSAIGNG